MITKKDAGKNQHRDPVCNMTVSSDSAVHYLYAGRDYYFCCQHCLHKFQAHPELYLNEGTAPSPATHSKLVNYICPMHAEVQQ
ncbi:YHS domain-containing protein, partial [candidate division KSB1 bacterium]|nr:YHS domain-containing protein [candidate division KSB1 bacterium]